MITEPLELNPVSEPKYFKTATIAMCARQELCLTLTDLNNVPYDLGSRDVVKDEPCKDACDEGRDADNPGFGDEGEECEENCAELNPGFQDGIEPKHDWPDVRLLLRFSPGYGMPLTGEVEGTIVDYEKNTVVFHLSEEQTTYIGVFIGEIMLYRCDTLLKRWPFYLSIEPSLANMDPRNQRRVRGGITVPEIRLALRDVNADYAEVLDEVEFKDAEIIWAMQQPVDRWNELLPPDRHLIYDYQNFPFRHNWLRATCAFLLEMAAHWYRRNDIPLQAGGMTVQDRAKHQTYEPKSKELLMEYDAWAKAQKTSMSMAAAWGSTGSTWPRGNGRYG